ncbi:MAG: Protease synthase and sporulation protein PAI 2 [Candidatus Accumulibacter appositus]|uniref:Protease synthase and sporulation protein PAI 2 n=1 Tax=Candidatus Accumulibacter appositus TaxID=1454003 RepID=A0A011NBS6_9PROT|nr:FMN-binding negative transcriptional regulator [Accumulibacter sp.]EXI80108.1 MAG: Protease synthase and sporulation protein PAI 2 [Candidatus Accumulibacter appositus]HRF05572.1 FMN-binding negative transcriptional regulator [Accumulibacter sp.]
MYIPRHFAVSDQDEMFAFIEANAFGQLISSVAGRPFSTHLPFLLSEDRASCIGHLARQNPQHRELAGQQVLLSLQGPHDYVSPSWYDSPGVPTWNYQAVHIYGQCRVFTDHEQLKAVVDSLTAKYESAFAEAWSPTYKASMLDAIVGVEVTVSEIQCKYKLSQNRSQQDRRRVIDELEKRGSNALAAAMRRNEP